MIKRNGSLPSEVFANRFGGNGEVKFTRIIEKDDFQGKGRLFSITALEPGCSLGLHTHTGEMEVYYILRGQGTVNDNGAETLVGPGDVVLTKDGESHAIANTGDTTLELVALILFS
ncbi:MAG: cupin domain-containing protein [Sporomusaceae bacterium]|nr:cupin domain-containing protein [Sporomusaceae bacterium]